MQGLRNAAVVITGASSGIGRATALARAAAQAFGRIDVWINNAGMALFGAYAQADVEKHRQVIETNLLGAMHGASAVPAPTTDGTLMHPIAQGTSPDGGWRAQKGILGKSPGAGAGQVLAALAVGALAAMVRARRPQGVASLLRQAIGRWRTIGRVPGSLESSAGTRMPQPSGNMSVLRQTRPPSPRAR